MQTPDPEDHYPSDDESRSTDHSGRASSVMTKDQHEEIAKSETKGVSRLRMVMLICLLGSAVAVSLFVFFFFRDAEVEEFETQFTSDAEKLLEAVGSTFDNTLGATDAFIVKLVTYARYSNSTWPYVTMPSFALHAEKVLKLSKAISLIFSPLVQEYQRDEWEKYAATHDGWIQESLDIQEKLDDWRHPIVREFNVTGIVDAFKGPSVEPYPYYNNTYKPVWQQAPILTGPQNPASPYNTDGWSLANNVQGNLVTLGEKKITIGNTFIGVVMDPTDELALYIARISQQWASQFIPEDEPSDEPAIQMNIPVMDTVDAVQIDITDDSIPVVGDMTFSYYYRAFFRNILPSKTQGIIVVTENVCGEQVFTYRIDGPKTIYLGVGDLHDPKYDNLEVSSLLSDMIGKKDGSHYTGPPLADEFCPKTVRIFPSQTMEDEYITRRPLFFTFLVALTFIFTSLVFVGYDWLVARRQKVVMSQANASGAIVRSLFPEKVRHQLYNEQRTSTVDKKNAKEAAYDAEDKKTLAEPTRLSGQANRPIAELYEETTIIFMDLAGFTHWSASRTPVEVFDLLEAVYGEFDKLSKRRGVFKIETIGDCYVAVTGIPHAQPDHALIMVKFARDCMSKFNEVKHELMDHLGADTEELELRVGMHSGATTGGVLRGEKGRFQLFGDTVNTASRMESNGVKGRIHCSQATADALIVKGKGSWVVPREDKVVAKGKGEMQTYFVHFSTNSGGQDTNNNSEGRTNLTLAEGESQSTPPTLPATNTSPSPTSSVHEDEEDHRDRKWGL